MVKALALSVQSLLASTSGDLPTALSLVESAGQLAKQDPDPAPELVRVALEHVGFAMPGLTHREWEVARLVARGQTNRQIAAQLYLSEKTIERYLSKIFSKLNISARASLATYVTRTVLAAPTELAAATA